MQACQGARCGRSLRLSLDCVQAIGLTLCALPCLKLVSVQNLPASAAAAMALVTYDLGSERVFNIKFICCMILYYICICLSHVIFRCRLFDEIRVVIIMRFSLFK